MSRARRADPQSSVRWRLRLVSLVFVAGFASVGARVVVLQTQSPARLADWVERQRERMVPMPPDRGRILDRKGKVLAESVETRSVYARPKEFRATAAERAVLASALGLSTKTLEKRLASPAPFVWLRRKAPPAVASAALALGVRGVGAEREPKRLYPAGELAAHVVGFAGTDFEGLEGVERLYDDVLAERGERVLAERDGRGRVVATPDAPPALVSPGLEIQLTIDMTIQHVLERELAEVAEAQRARGASAVVLEPETGRVLAMANWPTYDPNDLRTAVPARRRNRAVTDQFEPGSTMKPFLVAAAIHEGIGDLGSSLYCEDGAWRLARGVLIRDTHEYGRLTWRQVLQVSSNICAAKIALELGRERYHDYLRQFGFGEPTGVDLPGEASGRVPPWKSWYPVDLGVIGFGQGVSVTTLQLAAAYGALANGGRLLRPYVVERVVTPEGDTVHENRPRLVRRVIPATLARAMLEALESVVTPQGTAPKAAVAGYRIAGKTGTAEKVDPVRGGYGKGRVASFVGVAPADRPRLVIAVVVDEPKESSYGGVVAAPVFAAVASEALAQVGAPPSLAPAPAPAEEKRPPAEDDAIARALAHTRDLLRVAAGGPQDQRMPDLSGLTARAALRLLDGLDVAARVEGTGVLVRQAPAAGAQVARGETASLLFAAGREG